MTGEYWGYLVAEIVKSLAGEDFLWTIKSIPGGD